MSRLVLSFLFSFLCCSLGVSAQLVTYTGDVSGAVATVAANVTATPLTRVNGASTPGAPCSSGLSVIAFSTVTVFNLAQPAIELDVLPDAGFALDVTGFEATLRRSASGPANVRFAYSTDGGATWINQGTDQSPLVASCGTGSPASWSTIVHVTAPLALKFRIYGFNAGSGAGVMQLINFRVNGSVSVAPSCGVPPGLTATFVSTTDATLGYTPIPGATSYNIRYRPTGSSVWSSLSVIGTSASIASLSPATVYEAQVQAVCGAGSSTFGTSAFFTTATAGVASASSGKIVAYFNRPVDTTVSTGTYANYLDRTMADTLIAYINRARYTIDIAQYNYNQSASYSNIATAINSAITRGVRVRWIYDGNESNTGLALLDTAVHTLASPTTGAYGLMHNKVVIIDAMSADPNDAVVSTGSTVWGVNQFNRDYNNTVFIQDSALAHAYLDHFNMMWGDTGAYPNMAMSKFGPYKTDLGRHIFNIGGKTVELYFSPSDRTDAKIQAAINSANSDLYFGMYTFTMATDATAIVNRHTAGVYAPGIVDENSTISGPAYGILTSGIGSLLKTQTGAVIYHNKMLVVDPSNTCSDPLVLTGSHNWTMAAETKNDENTLIIHWDTLANEFYQSFKANYADLGGSLTPVAPCAVTACGVPAGLAASGISSSAAILSWSSLAAAVSYQLHYRAVGDTAWTVISTTATSVSLSLLLPATAYEFEVQAICASGTGFFSPASSFTTLALPCTPPVALSLVAVDTDLVHLSWVPSTAALGYIVNYRAAGATTWLADTTTAASVVLTLLAPATDYEVRVAVLCGAVSSPFSSIDTFTTLSPSSSICVAPATVTPAATIITTTSAIARWASVPGAMGYRVRYHKAGTPTWSYMSVTSNWASLSPLLPATLYEFQVQTMCDATTSSEFNGSSLFTTASASASVTNAAAAATLMAYVAPNPAQATAVLHYHTPTVANVQVALIDIAGRQVATWAELASPGENKMRIDAPTPGVYVLQIVAGGQTERLKLVVY